MKLKALFAAFFLAFAAFGINPSGFLTWKISWIPGDPNWNYGLTNYIPKTNSAWFVVGTTNLANTNYNTWPVLAVLTNWNNGPNSTITGTITVPALAQWFFACGSTNFQGTSSPSVPDTTGPLAYPVANSQIQNGQ